MGNKGSIVCKEEVPDQLLETLCVGLQSPQIEKTAAKAVANLDSILIINNVFCSLLEHHTEEDDKKSWC